MRKPKGDGRRPRRYETARPPLRGTTAEIVDPHTLLLRTSAPLTEDDAEFVRLVLGEYQAGRSRPVLGVPDSDNL